MLRTHSLSDHPVSVSVLWTVGRFFSNCWPSVPLDAVRPAMRKGTPLRGPTSPKERVHAHVCGPDQEAAVAGLRLDSVHFLVIHTVDVRASACNFCDSQEWCGSRAAVGCPEIVRSCACTRTRFTLSHPQTHGPNPPDELATPFVRSNVFVLGVRVETRNNVLIILDWHAIPRALEPVCG